MRDFEYYRPDTLAAALDLLAIDKAKPLAGGQTYIPILKQRLSQAERIVDLAALDLAGIEERDDRIVIGAMTTHEAIAASAVVRARLPGLADLASWIGDRQVRARGTIGGSLANNDPGACHPAAALALGATIRTDRRAIPADDFFTGLYTTALAPGELIVAVDFPIATASAYQKFRHPASRFAMVGVFVAHGPAGVRVAVTGAAQTGVFRATALEAALLDDWSPAAITAVSISSDSMNTDVHGSADYRAHLVGVMASRVVASLPSPARGPLAMRMNGERLIPAPRAAVWRALNDPEVLKAAIPGCDRLDGSIAEGFTTELAVGIGPIAARFAGKVDFTDVEPMSGYLMTGEGQGGSAGFAKVQSKVALADAEGGTRLTYTVDAQVGGKIAQLGARLIDAAASRMADQFFGRFAELVEGQPARAIGAPPAATGSPMTSTWDPMRALAYVAIVAVVGIVAITAIVLYLLAR